MLRLRGMQIGFTQSGLWRTRRSYVVRDLNLQSHAGQVHALIGASGVGKSLVAMALMGLLPRNAFLEGEVLWNEAPALGLMALMPQGASYLDPKAKIGRQIAWAARRAEVAVDWRRALAGFDLSPDLGDRYPHQLSGGEARRVLLAIASLRPAKVLIVDEPTVGLDPQASASVLRALRGQAESGKAVLMISHDLAAVVPIADQVTLLGAPHFTHPATAFAGQGKALCPQARAQWLALPQNGMTLDA